MIGGIPVPIDIYGNTIVKYPPFEWTSAAAMEYVKLLFVSFG
jgi:hypothetical protein